MTRLLLLSAVLALTLAAPLAAENVEGYLVDKMCSAKIVEGGQDAAKSHTKQCALMPNCKGSGFGLVTAEGKFLKFDSDGDRMAEQMLGIYYGDDDIEVTVNGDIKGDTIVVRAIQFL